MNKLVELFDEIESTKTKDIKLLFITRYLKKDVKKSSKMLDKYLFKTYQIDIDSEIREHLHELSQEKISYVLKKGYEMTEYDVISDDTQCIMSYSMKNKVLSFSDVVNNQLDNKSELSRISSIEELIVSNEEIWAYCIGFENIEPSNKKVVYAFRKVQPSKVAIDEKENVKALSKIIRTHFNTKSKKLEILKGETINLDKQIDCLYYDGEFYILHKGYFEQIIGLQEEYKEESKVVVKELEDSGVIKGLELVKEEIEKTPAIHKKLVRIRKIGNHKDIDINKAKEVAEKYGIEIKIENNQIQIINNKDIENVLKILSDFYKTGEISGKSYGTYSGKQLTVRKAN
ncbi:MULTISPECIES: Kiwa anti-phage protein KwaB-like domain-containing protein [Pasteurellaceae]|uniref:DUF4868 domain-containing protein n=1 Tax=Pasteurella atlantica TaxID=2827233 RepID=A0AAW8CF95_9PAST|nr:Kiwa anti-phage protein KwaB-like domain-containing protein [Pasteurella atlantica]MBR0573523.1 DUF4868 domain-containing protein [Pasteurella atlantica]MDP8039524.1 DUF4868 domain-containing protein [Pasteurella atlantica]MDP8041615.1 DUF4868 domain-containing protein [Pasteurella atlantica]MDP8043752.1 DUF4868 domain-containing protein [Pasteurella atlantica]MDP8045751.1 DUF4868 domain-containing protein [Pasteurella atlantica]